MSVQADASPCICVVLQVVRHSELGRGCDGRWLWAGPHCQTVQARDMVRSTHYCNQDRSSALARTRCSTAVDDLSM